jgi:hypothetical protein
MRLHGQMLTDLEILSLYENTGNIDYNLTLSLEKI